MPAKQSVTRRRFVQGSGLGLAGLALGAGAFRGADAQDETQATPEPGGGHDMGNMGGEVATGAAPVDQGRAGWPGLAFVGGGESNKLWVLDAKQHKLVTAIDVGGPLNERTDPKRYPNLHDVHAMVFTKDFREFFTVNSWEYPQSYAIKFDPLTLREVQRGPAGEGGHHSALSPDDVHLYVCNQYATTVSVLDRVSMEKLMDLEVGMGADYITPSMYWDGKVIDTPYLFVTADKVPSVVAIDWRKNEVVKSIPCSGANHGVNLTPDAKEVWVAVPGGGEIMIVDVGMLEPVASLKLVEGGGPIHTSFSPDGAFAFVTHLSPDGLLLLKIDVKERTEIWRATGSGAHLMVTPDGKEAWTLNHTFEQGDRYPYLLGGQPLSAARVFDTETGEWIAEMTFERRPHEIQFVPYTAVGLPAPPEEAVAAVPVPEGARRVTLNASADLFEPTRIEAKTGETLQFEIVNKDSYDHIFGSGDARLKLDTVLVPASKTTYVDWTVDVQAGEYKLICGIHPGMETLLVVS